MDFSQISEAIGLASSAAGATEKASGTIKTIMGLFQSGTEPDKDHAESLLNDIAAQLTTANMMNVQLSTALKAVSQDIKTHSTFEAEKARYELFQTPQNVMVFKLRDDAANGDPVHFVCPVCMNKDRLISYISGEGNYKTCQTNREHIFRFKNTPMPEFRGVSIF